MLLTAFSNMAVFKEAVTTIKCSIGVSCSASMWTVDPEAIIIESFFSISLAAAIAILFFSFVCSFSFS